PAQLEEQAKKLKAFERCREISSATDLLRGLLAYVYTAHSFQHLSMWSVLVGLADVSANDWRKRLQKASAWLDWQMPRSARDGLIGLSVASARRFKTAKSGLSLCSFLLEISRVAKMSPSLLE